MGLFHHVLVGLGLGGFGTKGFGTALENSSILTLSGVGITERKRRSFNIKDYEVMEEIINLLFYAWVIFNILDSDAVFS